MIASDFIIFHVVEKAMISCQYDRDVVTILKAVYFFTALSCYDVVTKTFATWKRGFQMITKVVLPFVTWVKCYGVG